MLSHFIRKLLLIFNIDLIIRIIIRLSNMFNRQNVLVC